MCIGGAISGKEPGEGVGRAEASAQAGRCKDQHAASATQSRTGGARQRQARVEKRSTQHVGLWGRIAEKIRLHCAWVPCACACIIATQTFSYVVNTVNPSFAD